MNWQARRDGLCITSAGKDLIIYDETGHTLHTLNPMAAFVWQRLDGTTSAQSILAAAQASVDPSVEMAMIDTALEGMAKAGLLEGNPLPVRSHSRRAILRRAAITGAVVPSVVSITAPLAAQAQSVTCNPGQFPTAEQCEIALVDFELTLDPDCSVVVEPYCVKLTFGPCYAINYAVNCV